MASKFAERAYMTPPKKFFIINAYQYQQTHNLTPISNPLKKVGEKITEKSYRY
jgi:hypothetical protein